MIYFICVAMAIIYGGFSFIVIYHHVANTYTYIYGEAARSEINEKIMEGDNASRKLCFILPEFGICLVLYASL